MSWIKQDAVKAEEHLSDRTEPINAVVESSFGIEGNPNGIASQSPRLTYSATLGHRIAFGPNPNGVVAFAPRMMNNQPWRRRVTAKREAATPSGLPQLAVVHRRGIVTPG